MSEGEHTPWSNTFHGAAHPFFPSSLAIPVRLRWEALQAGLISHFQGFLSSLRQCVSPEAVCVPLRQCVSPARLPSGLPLSRPSEPPCRHATPPPPPPFRGAPPVPALGGEGRAGSHGGRRLLRGQRGRVGQRGGWGRGERRGGAGRGVSAASGVARSNPRV